MILSSLNFSWRRASVARRQLEPKIIHSSPLVLSYEVFRARSGFGVMHEHVLQWASFMSKSHQGCAKPYEPLAIRLRTVKKPSDGSYGLCATSLLFAQSLIGWVVDTEVIELPVTSNKHWRRNWLITDTDANRHESWSSNDLTEAYSGRRMNFDYFEVIPLCFLHLLRDIRICPAVASHKDVLLSFRSFYLSALQVVTTQLLGIFTAYTGTQWVDRNLLQVLQGPRISFLQLK
jgi:hypothetical protein